MRKLIVCNIISLDGFYSGPGGDVMVMPFDAGFSDYNGERLRAADTLLLGRTSYEGFRSYWLKVAEDMTQPAVEREISRLNAAIEKVVVSNSLRPDEVEGWGSTRIVRRACQGDLNIPPLWDLKIPPLSMVNLWVPCVERSRP